MEKVSVFQQNLESLIQQNERVIPPNMYGPNKVEKAKWGDYLWYYKDLKTSHLYSFPFTTHVFGKRRYGASVTQATYALPRAYTILLQIFILDEIIRLRISLDEKSNKLRSARAAVTAALSLEDLNDLTSSQWSESHKYSNDFWKYCKNLKLISGSSKPVITDLRDRSGGTSFEKKTFKSADASTVIAIGHIFNEVFKDVKEDGTVKEGGKVDFRFALSISMAVFGLASPSRTQAEVPLVQAQNLKTHSPRNGEPIHYLSWAGSKGYSDNNTHILSVMAPYVDKVMNFFMQELKPDRCFVKYIKNPSISWSELLKGFDVDRKRKANLNFNNKPNLFSVAYALGFYPVDLEVKVVKDPHLITAEKGSRGFRIAYLTKNIDKNMLPKAYLYKGDRIKDEYFYYTKHVAQLDLSERIMTIGGRYSGLSVLGGFTFTYNHKYIRRHHLDIMETTEKLAELFVGDIKKAIPGFPYSSALKGGSKLVDLEFSLFCLRSFRIGNSNTDSPIFSISGLPKTVSVAVIAFKDRKSISSNGSLYEGRNIFEEYGFSRIHLNLNSLRHFSNTLLEQSEIPLEIIASFSGRKSVKQTLEYVHTSEEDKSERLISILDLDEEKSVRIISKEELENAGNYPASITETGICLQELNVTPCEYVNDFLSGCFGCESSCYTCGDHKAIELLEKDLVFQNKRLDVLKAEKKYTFSDAAKDWLFKHTQGVVIMEQLIHVLKTFDSGLLVRLAYDKSILFITNTKTGEVQEFKVALPTNKEIFEYLMPSVDPTTAFPKGMLEIIESIKVD